MMADPLWSCVMLLCGPLPSFVVLCGPLRYLVILFRNCLDRMMMHAKMLSQNTVPLSSLIMTQLEQRI